MGAAGSEPWGSASEAVGVGQGVGMFASFRLNGQAGLTPVVTEKSAPAGQQGEEEGLLWRQRAVNISAEGGRCGKQGSRLPRVTSTSEASLRTRQDTSHGPVPLEFILHLFSSFSSNFPLLK